jgi:hypothetical protein
VLGGNPRLTDTAEWPFWTGHGRLSFIAAVDCAVAWPDVSAETLERSSVSG